MACYNIFNRKTYEKSQHLRKGNAFYSTLIVAVVIPVSHEHILFGYNGWQENSKLMASRYTDATMYDTFNALAQLNTTIINPPITMSFASDATFSEQQIISIYNSLSLVTTYVTRGDSDPIHVEITTGPAYSLGIPEGSTALASANLATNQIIFYLDNIDGISIFLIAFHEFLHILGYGIQSWNELLFLNTTTYKFHFTGNLTSLLAGTTPIVDPFSQAHWSGETILSSGEFGDIMEPYLDSQTRISAESLAVIPDVHLLWSSRACRNLSDCNLLSNDPNATCHQFAKELPGVCLDSTSCLTTTCVTIFKETHELEGHTKVILHSASAIFLFAITVLREISVFDTNTIY